jgi:hypothetical protein
VMIFREVELHLAKIAVTVLQARSECRRARLRVRLIMRPTPLSRCPRGDRMRPCQV